MLLMNQYPASTSNVKIIEINKTTQWGKHLLESTE